MSSSPVLASLLLAGMLYSGSALAQDYPSKAIRLVLSFPPGGGTDAIARPLAQRLAKSLGQPVVVENRPGANGIVSLELVARAAPDGHTVILSNAGPIAMNPGLYDKLPYDPVRSFAPVTLVGTAQYVLLVHPSTSVGTVRAFVALAKRHPGSINYATTGIGSTPHLAGELFREMAGIDIVGVQYKGGGPALIDLISGQVSMYFASMPSALPHMQSRRLRGLGVSGAKRAAGTPDLPTIAEAGVPGFEVDGWYGVLAPAGTDGSRVGRLASTIHDALRDGELRQLYAVQGIDVVYGSPAEFAGYISREIDKWTRVVRKAGIKGAV